MPSSSQWLAFLVASVIFVEIPGPSLLFTIGRALTVGRREAMLSVLGNGLGVMVQVVLVAVGLGAVVAASATAYTVIKVAGAAYVVWLGIQAIRHRADARLAMASGAPVRRGHPVRIGLTVGATNPKTVVFLVAFLPQFTDPGGPIALQTMLLGAVFCVLAIVSDSVWALVAGAARHWFARRPQRLDSLSAAGGTMMVGLGATMIAVE
jgi:threonine/homoserine/homoserine lactone efflux protein